MLDIIKLTLCIKKIILLILIFATLNYYKIILKWINNFYFKILSTLHKIKNFLKLIKIKIKEYSTFK